MKFKQALLATTAAVILTAGGAIAQESPSSRDGAMPAPSSPATNLPSSNDASGGVTVDNSLKSGSSSGSSTSGMSSSTSSSAGGALSASSLTEIKDESAIVSSFDMNVKKLKGMDVVGSDGKKIGEVDKVLGDSSNQPKAVTVDAGGFLGIGGHEVIVPFEKLSKGSNDKELKTALSKDELKGLSEYQAKRDAGPARDSGVATGSGGQPATSVPAR